MSARCRWRAAALALALWPAACTLAPDYGPRATVHGHAGALLPVRFQRGICLLLVDLPGHRQQQAMLLDTGTDRTLLDFATARAIGLDAIGDESVVTATGAAVAAQALTRLPWLRSGDCRFEDIDVVGLDLSALREHGGLDIVGIAGCDLFRHCLLQIDYPQRTVRVLPYDRAPATPPVHFTERSPWLDLELAGMPLRALLDTGFQQAVALPPDTALPWRHAPRDAGDLAAIGGTAERQVARLQGDLCCCGLQWRDPWIVLAPGAPKIGAALLRHCVVTLDAAAGRVWVERTR